MITARPIPAILFQTSKLPLPDRVLSKTRSRLTREWRYLHFDDQGVLDYFQSHPLDAFPDVVQKYNSFASGAHRADLFRYYFLYLNGGVYMDSDVELRADICDIIRDHQFITVNGAMFPGTVFNGFLCSSPGHPVILSALRHLYASTQADLAANYFHTCAYVHQLVCEAPADLGIGLYEEAWHTDCCLRAVDQEGRTLLLHYWIEKHVPRFHSLYYLSYFLRLELWALMRHYLSFPIRRLATLPFFLQRSSR